MNPKKKWETVNELLEAALSVDVSERDAFLKSSGAEIEMIEEAGSLLAFENEAAEAMNFSAVEFSKDFISVADESSMIGQIVGKFRIIKEIGFGGMGAVFLAERVDGKFSQKVALKLLKREMNTSELRSRFEQEKEILASLEHPNIARLLDAGTNDENIPYIALEYVEGLPIGRYCEQHDLGLDQRLNLFRKVCSAVDFAHRNLIVHRDLKPSNILVDDGGTPKLLDFGISKILTTDSGGSSTASVTQMGVMTPGYASPEQLNRKSVTTATDIYSLGVILYELLSGHRPFADEEDDINKIYEAVLNTDPPLPSLAAYLETDDSDQQSGSIKNATNPTAIEGETRRLGSETRKDLTESSATAHPGIKPQKLRGDLDNIILKALQKDPDRRYNSAQEFSKDIERHQQGIPVLARPSTLGYRASRFFSRNRLAVVLGSLVLAAIAIGIIGILWQANVARAESLRAQKRFDEVRRLANSNLFEVYPEVEKLEGSIKAREIIVRNALQYLDSLAGEAGDDIELQRELAAAYERIGEVQGAASVASLGDIKTSNASFEKARVLREGVLRYDPENNSSMDELAANYTIIGRNFWSDSNTKGAEDVYDKALVIRRKLVEVDPNSTDYQDKLANLLMTYGRIPAFVNQNEKASKFFIEALAIINRLIRKEPDNLELKKTLARGLRFYSGIKQSAQDYTGALVELEKAVKISDELAKVLPDDFRIQRTTWINDYRICELHINTPNGSKAVPACEKAIAFPKRTVEKEPENAEALNDLSVSYFNAARASRIAEKHSDTVVFGRRAIEVVEKLLAKSKDSGEFLRSKATYLTEVGGAFAAQKKTSAAMESFSESEKILRSIVSLDKKNTMVSYDLGMQLRQSGNLMAATGRVREALTRLREALDIAKKLRDADSLRKADESLVSDLEQEIARISKN